MRTYFSSKPKPSTIISPPLCHQTGTRIELIAARMVSVVRVAVVAENRHGWGGDTKYRAVETILMETEHENLDHGYLEGDHCVEQTRFLETITFFQQTVSLRASTLSSSPIASRYIARPTMSTLLTDTPPPPLERASSDGSIKTNKEEGCWLSRWFQNKKHAVTSPHDETESGETLLEGASSDGSTKEEGCCLSGCPHDESFCKRSMAISAGINKVGCKLGAVSSVLEVAKVLSAGAKETVTSAFAEYLKIEKMKRDSVEKMVEGVTECLKIVAILIVCVSAIGGGVTVVWILNK